MKCFASLETTIWKKNMGSSDEISLLFRTMGINTEVEVCPFGLISNSCNTIINFLYGINTSSQHYATLWPWKSRHYWECTFELFENIS